MSKALQSSTDSSQKSYMRKSTNTKIKLDDSDVDTSDIPEQTDEDWAKFEENVFYRPNVIYTDTTN